MRRSARGRINLTGSTFPCRADRATKPTRIYTGTISITADQGNATIPVTLTVWNFELPAQPSEFSLWSLCLPPPAIR